MSPNIARPQTPEERELEKKEAELAVLRVELAQRELDLATLQNECHVVEAQYLRTVGVLYAELDDIEAQIAEAQARKLPNDQRLREQASEARVKATESAGSVGAALKQQLKADFKPAEHLKELYREVARLLHPDLTTDEMERARRNRLMADANRAYAEADEAKLRAILDEWVSNPESVQGEGVAAELVRTIRKIHQVKRRLDEIETETAEVKRSELYGLKMAIEVAESQDRDLFQEMVDALKRQIDIARMQLATLSTLKRPL